MIRLGVHKRWNHKFLLKEIACRVPEHAGLSPKELVAYLAGDEREEAKISTYSHGGPDSELSDAVFALHRYALASMRRAQYAIYKHGTLDRSELALAAWHEVLHLLLHFGRGYLLRGSAHCWGSSIREVAETLACAYALGWNVAADKIAVWTVEMMPNQGVLWSKEDMDPQWEKKREPFARFIWALWADFAKVTLPAMPPHPYDSPAYDKLLACWKSPDPSDLIEPLLGVCDWHTHECMYSRSMQPSKNVDFINDTLMGWPVEVHMVYRLRERLGLGLPPELDHPLMKAPLGAYLAPAAIPRDERLDKVVRRACAEVAGLEELLKQAIKGA